MSKMGILTLNKLGRTGRAYHAIWERYLTLTKLLIIVKDICMEKMK